MSDSAAKTLKPRERILQSINTLFYQNGCSNTGVREILEASGTHKASLYRHFENKDDLVRAYLEVREKVFADFLNKMAARSPSPQHFFRFWQSGFYKLAQAGELFGCPLANLNAELGAERAKFRKDIQAVGWHWFEIIKVFLGKEKKTGRIPRQVNIDKATSRIMIIYQGHLQIYALNKDPSTLLSMADDMSNALR